MALADRPGKSVRAMVYRRLGRTNLQVSAVGFGTCQLRMVPRDLAIETLMRGFSLGVNIIHTAPDYEGADEIVREAVERAQRQVVVCSQGYGSMANFEELFERTYRKFARPDGALAMFGVACVDDRERLRENVWGTGGMVNFLQKKKREGRLLGTFCTTHGRPDYIRKLIDSGAFDAIMIAYNPLGFHLLSANLGEAHMESLSGNLELFSHAAKHDVGLMLMKPLAGGLLCDGKAFPPYFGLDRNALLQPGDVLRYLLALHPQVTCVVPGTASVAEAEENALAGFGPLEIAPEKARRIAERIEALGATICSRCGHCDDLCSRKLPVSWLFRAAYIDNRRSMTFETPSGYEYFHLHKSGAATCASCDAITCLCPAGIDIPGSLKRIHGQMLELRQRGVLATPTNNSRPLPGLAGRVLRQERFEADGRAYLRLVIENNGSVPWLLEQYAHIFLKVSHGRWSWTRVPLCADVVLGQRCHFVFAAPRSNRHSLKFQIVLKNGVRQTVRVPLEVSKAEQSEQML
jgi:predicted aldo/keto reductase-like oxidoreductase